MLLRGLASWQHPERGKRMTYERDEGERIAGIPRNSKLGYTDRIQHLSVQLEFIGYRLCEIVDMLEEMGRPKHKPPPGPPIATAAS